MRSWSFKMACQKSALITSYLPCTIRKTKHKAGFDQKKKHCSEHFITISTDHTKLLSTFNATHPVDWHRDVCMYFGGGNGGCVLDSCQLVPKAGRHKVLHLVCKKAQWCKKSTEELWKKEKERGKKTVEKQMHSVCWYLIWINNIRLTQSLRGQQINKGFS